MFENLFDSLNLLLLQHPHVLHVMRTLFWVKYWLLLGIVGVFVYLVYTDQDNKITPKNNGTPKPAPGSVFIA
jgi:hypothetical protein